MKQNKLIEDPPFRAFLLGNESVVRGAIEAGVRFASTYPGTPASEIGDNIYKIAKDEGIHFEYAVNEKVALEMAIGASFAGQRSIVSMKHVGLNVASDALITFAYLGVRSGVVIVSADDPSCHSSQNEQDNRYYALFANIPMLEPSTSDEARFLTKTGFKISEEYGVPVLLRITTRTAHTRGVVNYEHREIPPSFGEFQKNPLRYVVVPAVARVLHREHIQRMEKLAGELKKINLNKITINGEKGIVSSGVSRNYVKDALEFYGLSPKVSLYELLFTYPFCENEIYDFLSKHKEILVVEELEPFIEDSLLRFAYKMGLNVKISGKRDNIFPYAGEFNPDIVQQALGKFFGIKTPSKKIFHLVELPPRPPVLCSGCPHRATYLAIKIVVKDEALFPTDIGCYTLGINPPLSMADFLVCMGSSLTIGSSFSLFTGKKVFSFIGDSTFFHAGITGLVNAVYNKHKFVLVIMDNRTTAMTGFQPHPGSAVDKDKKEILIEDVVKGLGVEFVKVIDPFDLLTTLKVIKEALEYDGLAVIISKSPCPQMKKKLETKQEEITYIVDKTLCKTCGNLEAGSHCGVEIIKDYEMERIHKKIDRINIEEISKTPPCTFSCPAKICVQGYVGLLSAQKFFEAYELIRKRIPFPSVCAYVCHRPCEDACFEFTGSMPVAIRELKKVACIFGRKENIVQRGEKRGIKVALIGGGPASLTCAHDLTILGYDCTIFEKSEHLGGLMERVIPPFRLPPNILEDEINEILSLGIEVKTNVEIPKDKTIEDLKKEGYKAIFIGTGLSGVRKLGIPGENLDRVLDGIEFLERVKKGERVNIGESVIVIGGGNTAFDSARSAKRLGANSVFIIYRRTKNEMPALKEEIEEGIKEDVTILELLSPVEIKEGEYGVKNVVFQKMKLGDYDESRRRKPIPLEEGEGLSKMIIPADTVIVAVGEKSEIEKIFLDKKGFLKIDRETMMTEIEGIFAGGDIRGGKATIIDAIADGKRAAIGIHSYISGEKIKEKLELPFSPLKEKVRKKDEKKDKFQRIEELKDIEEIKREAVRESMRCIQCGLCANCNVCIDFLGCPAISKIGENINIDPALCTGCGICAIICPNNAIKAVKKLYGK